MLAYFLLLIGLYWWIDRRPVPSVAEQQIVIKPRPWLSWTLHAGAFSALLMALGIAFLTGGGEFSALDGYGMSAVMVMLAFLIRSLAFHLTVRTTQGALYFGTSKIPWVQVKAITPGSIWLRFDLTKRHWGRHDFYAGGPLTHRLGDDDLQQLEALRSAAHSQAEIEPG